MHSHHTLVCFAQKMCFHSLSETYWFHSQPVSGWDPPMPAVLKLRVTWGKVSNAKILLCWLKIKFALARKINICQWYTTCVFLDSLCLHFCKPFESNLNEGLIMLVEIVILGKVTCFHNLLHNFAWFIYIYMIAYQKLPSAQYYSRA